MQYAYRALERIGKEYGEAFYLLDVGRFTANYRELLAAFTAEYPNTVIAYSYKTNYIPRLCQAVDDLGGYAEVVSHMEYALARRIGVAPGKIVFNGPYKQPEAVRELLLSGGIVHLDSLRELELIQSISDENPSRMLNIGIRVSFPVGDGVVSRFGFDAQGEEFQTALRAIGESVNIRLRALHCHFASRALETWKARAEGMLRLIAENGLQPERVDIGGGMYGKMDDRLKMQFGGEIPTYRDYARAVGGAFRTLLNGDYQPTLMIEPGSALAGDCMDLAARVQSVKTVQGTKIATVLASTHNLHMGTKTPSADVFRPAGVRTRSGAPVHVAGYTCIESDYLVKDFGEPLSVGDYVVFRNVGSYSFVFKPPFILPDFPILALDEKQSVELVRRAETDQDIFRTYF